MQNVRPSPRLLAPFATDPARSRGRRIAEPVSATRTPFQRDRDRIVHSSAFRRLTHKTQVFITTDGDHFRSRLTHSLEVAQIAGSIARVLSLDEDLAEALALAHDFGHTPFGHEGERVLARMMADHGGFDHNVQAYRIVTRLERRYAHFDGLNLTYEMLEGLVKHNGPPGDDRTSPFYGDPELADLNLVDQAGLEAQIAALSDDIAYDSHDIDDGLRSGILSLDALREVDLIADIVAEVEAEAPGLEPIRQTHELARRLLTRMIEDAIAETIRRIAGAGVASADDVAAQPGPMVAFSGEMAAAEKALKRTLHRELYADVDVLQARDKAGQVVADLFEVFANDPALLPDSWRDPADEAPRRLRRTCDYIAGMTDRFALGEHSRLVGNTPQLKEWRSVG
ncbi:deoxyguanosinetriphosphate triphosphohydrolase [Acuticoccus sp. MNP-M23]|uniref:deoxyguanosinetriphosphate triphosphohydrolase n=1 Tax=Acuticoccus sp. MNP-M23 TaxID=3072793 RepID=UPI0028160D94|nr:deoxyguanosinetriphosphate triphosphohydrolase [Acuticoccus sp. MNP-M23]WMS42423.1 deoxyguanosinetriphosphate triphosphohydrolase [Acuticoccus sp. MNP-M23]